MSLAYAEVHLRRYDGAEHRYQFNFLTSKLSVGLIDTAGMRCVNLRILGLSMLARLVVGLLPRQQIGERVRNRPPLGQLRLLLHRRCVCAPSCRVVC